MIEHIADHEERAVELVPLVHSQRTGRMGLIRALGAVAQVAEDDFYAAYQTRQLALASGKILDFWGWLAGVPRGGLDDRYYRKLIETAIAAKYCVGNTDGVIRLWQLATGGYVEFLRYPHRCIVLTAWVDDWLPEPYMRRVAEVVRSGCPLGSVVLLESLYNYVGDAERTRAPLPANPLGSATGAKVW